MAKATRMTPSRRFGIGVDATLDVAGIKSSILRRLHRHGRASPKAQQYRMRLPARIDATQEKCSRAQATGAGVQGVGVAFLP